MCWLLYDDFYDAERKVDKWKRRLSSDRLMNIQQDMDFYLLHNVHSFLPPPPPITSLEILINHLKTTWNTSKRFLIFNVNLFSSDPEWLRLRIKKTNTNGFWYFSFASVSRSIQKTKSFSSQFCVISWRRSGGLACKSCHANSFSVVHRKKVYSRHLKPPRNLCSSPSSAQFPVNLKKLLKNSRVKLFLLRCGIEKRPTDIYLEIFQKGFCLHRGSSRVGMLSILTVKF